MGLGGISPMSLLLILLIVVVVFGTSRLKSIGGDLGGALKSFRKAMDSDDDKKSTAEDTKQKQIDSDKADAEFEERKQKENQH